MINIHSLDQFYLFIKQEHGTEYADTLKEFVDEKVSRETTRLKENIDILSDGLEQAVYHIYAYRRKYNDIIDNVYADDLIKAEMLSYKIYGDNNKTPFYNASLSERRAEDVYIDY